MKTWGKDLYIIHAGPELTKLGRSQHPNKRLQEISRGMPFAECRLWSVFPDAGWLGPALQSELASLFEKRAEWYRASAHEISALVVRQLAELERA